MIDFQRVDIYTKNIYFMERRYYGNGINISKWQFSRSKIAETLQLISINDLSDELHNQYIKCFASKNEERRKAFFMLQNSTNIILKPELCQIFFGLNRVFVQKNKGVMIMESQGYTTADIMEIGKEVYQSIIDNQTIDDFFRAIDKKELIGSLDPEERLKKLTAEEILRRFPAEERLRGLPPEERLRGLPPEEIKNYLDKINKISN
ncbi:MAG: hypothetical protein HQK65_00825 [Desulfamplus sp.]|nr:hypothetical protein [Desulfamplus sp.]